MNRTNHEPWITNDDLIYFLVNSNCLKCLSQHLSPTMIPNIMPIRSVEQNRIDEQHFVQTWHTAVGKFIFSSFHFLVCLDIFSISVNSNFRICKQHSALFQNQVNEISTISIAPTRGSVDPKYSWSRRFISLNQKFHPQADDSSSSNRWFSSPRPKDMWILNIC